MRQSKLFTKTRREAPKDEVSKNAQLLIRAGYIHKEMAGVYSYLPLGLRTLNKIENIIRVEMDKIGREVLLPALSPQELWKQTGRLGIVDSLMRTVGANELSLAKNDASYVLNPTHEELITPIAQENLQSYKDLPAAYYQIQNKFRNEARAKSGLLRGREFRMKDLYSFHRDEADLLKYYEQAKDSYRAVFNTLDIGKDTFITLASGGDFTTGFSHEFQTLVESGEDTIYLDRATNIAYNKEVVTDENAKKLGVNFDSMEQVKACEVGNIFPLNTKFSKAFNYNYTDEEGKQQLVYMGCYGIGPSRLMGILVEKFADDKGIVWPEAVAPFRVHLVSLANSNDDVVQEADELYRELSEAGVEVLYDDRDARAGEKFADSDLIGIPLRIVVSEKTLAAGKFECVERAAGTTHHKSLSELIGMLTTR
ncbi:MAG TPA: aminoacyl--tRNA ligase-related protein [Candidatus Paceibacterota bacterium]|jgi:prolyl-tRNA synthetase|nr:aminoacyl--tRNA ligase-related protein [Candidatus Paceibacterota bacterium]